MRYTTLGRTGLRVSAACLGTMTFGTEWGWGSAAEAAFDLLDRFREAGGTFIDTANGYTNGTSERIIGEYLQARGERDRLVLATKFSFATSQGDPNAGGNGRKHIVSALEASLSRLRTDYVDVYWLHNWDRLTPVEEVMRTLDDLVRAGKVRYIGFSNAPAWYIARAQTIAELRGWERLCALQLEYSLLERGIEHEHLPAARELGMSLCPWSPLASGLLTGKYQRDGSAAAGEGRLAVTQKSGNPGFLKLFTDRNWGIVDEVVTVARGAGLSAAQVALAWVAGRPGVASTIIGATKPEQLADNLRALDTPLPDDLRTRLDRVSQPEAVYPDWFFEPTIQERMTGGVEIDPYPGGSARRG